MEDQRLRDRLTALADEIPPQTAVPQGLVPRAHRRGVLMVVATLICVALASFGLVVGVRAVLRVGPERPAVPMPTPALTGPIDDRITVMLDHRGDAGAAVFDPDGEPSARTVLRTGPWGYPLGWSSDGQRLLFATRDGGVLVLEPDDRVVTLAETGGFWGASWSPDGSQIVFGKAVGDGTSLYLIDADGSNERLLLPAGSSERYLYPSWSPTGSTIAFLRKTGFVGEPPSRCADACQRAADRGTELWTVDADGSSARPLLPNASVDPRAFSYNAPAWSPDGTRLVFAAYVNEGPSDIQLLVVDPFALSALNEGPTQLTSEHGDALAPAWSPDGSRIAFIRNAGKRNELRLIRNTGNTYELRFIDADGSNERSLFFLVLPVFEGSPVLWEMLPAQ